MMKKLPPREKVPEAFSAIADKRVKLEDGRASVLSSDLTKTYTVTWEGDTYRSNDNASYWQGYVGYPILSVLMLQGRLPYSAETAKRFRGIPWKRLNTENKSRYSVVVQKVLEEIAESSEDYAAIESEIDRVMAELAALDIKTKRSPLRPPK